MIPSFDKEYWIGQLTKEVGLDGVAYEDLANHTVNFSSFFDLEEEGRRNAKEYVDSQLEIIEHQYRDIGVETSPQQVGAAIGAVLDGIEESYEPELPVFNPTNADIPQLIPVVQEVSRSKYRYFDVVIGEGNFMVVTNHAGDDWRIQDQINHIVNTTFFVEEKREDQLTGGERAITYYQFVNAIQPFLKQNTDLSVFEGISQGSVFDGVKLKGFND